jgi:hypothetical protein
MYHPKRNPTAITYYATKIISEAEPFRVTDSPNLTADTRVKATKLPGRCTRQLRNSYAGANTVHSWAERMFILEHYFASKSFSSAYPDKEVTNNTAIHRHLTTSVDTGNVCDKCWSSSKTAEITAVPISSESQLQQCDM